MEKTIQVLNGMQREGAIVDYALGGAIAALFYIEPIETHDLDVFISLPRSRGRLLSLEPIYSYLSGRGYEADEEHVVNEGVPVQFLVASTGLVEEVMRKGMSREDGA